jgi:hypothetical protein
MVMCKHDTEFCSIFLPGVPDADPTYTCEQLPSECMPDPACKCLPGNGGNTCPCTESPQGDLTVTCMGI